MPTRFVIVCQVNYSALGGNLNLYHPFPILLLCHICVIWGTTNFGKCPPSTTFCFFYGWHSWLFKPQTLPFARLPKGKIFGSSPKGRGRKGIGAPPSTLERWPEKEDTRMRVLRLRVLHLCLTLDIISTVFHYCSRQVCVKFRLVDFDRVGEWVASKIKENATTDMSKKAINWTMKRAVSYSYLLQNKGRKCDSVIVCKRTKRIKRSELVLLLCQG